jgi:hypothetical protein
MVQATSKVGSICGNASQGFALQGASITEQHGPFGCEGHHRVPRGLLWYVPWGQRIMSTYTAFLVPHRLHVGPGLVGTASRAEKKGVQTVGQCKTGTIGEGALGPPRAAVCVYV